MEVSERLQMEAEAAGEGQVLLLKEGTFWKAYEHSAYTLHQMFGFKPSLRYVKKVTQTVVSVGFPLQSLAKFFPQTAGVKPETEVVRIRVKALDEDLEAWKMGLQSEEETVLDEMLTARYENLPIYKAVYDVLMKSLTASRHMAKDYRYTLGEDLKKALFSVLVLVYKANKEKDKTARVACIAEAEEKMVEVRLLCRILNDCKQMPKNLYAQLAFDLVQVDKHLANWRKYNQKEQIIINK